MISKTKRVAFTRLFRKPSFILFFGCLPALFIAPGICLLHLPAQAQTRSTGAVVSFPLNYVKKSTVFPISPGKQEVKFRKEPDFGRDKILRRALVTGPDKNDFMGFAVNFTERTLYLDLNQNLDLSDDPQGIYKGTGGSSSLQFKDVQVSLHKNGVDRFYSLDLLLINGNIAYLYVTSSYNGDIELDGRKWRLMVQDNLDGEINHQDRFSISLIAGSAEDRQRGLAYDAMPVSKDHFLCGHNYQVDFSFSAGSEAFAPLTAHFTEINSPTGELILDGQFIQRLVLQGEDVLALVDVSAQSTVLPIGKYRVQAIYLESPFTNSFNATSLDQIPQFSLVPGTPYRLKAGGPLESSVTAAVSGNVLKMNYVLRGAGGEQYANVNPDRSKPPRWAIYKGDRQLASGNFEFG